MLKSLPNCPTDSCRQHTNDIQPLEEAATRGFGRLCIGSANRSSMGSYFCIASNGIPPSVSKRIQLVVLCKLFSLFDREFENFNCLVKTRPHNELGSVCVCVSTLSLFSIYIPSYFDPTSPHTVATHVRSEKPLVGAPAGAQAVSLDCIVEASPQPNHFLWYKGSKLSAPLSSSPDSILYHCPLMK